MGGVSPGASGGRAPLHCMVRAVKKKTRFVLETSRALISGAKHCKGSQVVMMILVSLSFEYAALKMGKYRMVIRNIWSCMCWPEKVALYLCICICVFVTLFGTEPKMEVQ